MRKRKQTRRRDSAGFYRMEDPRKEKFKARGWVLVVLILLLVLLASIYWSNWTFGVEEYQVSSPFIPNAFTGFTICQISDLQGQEFGKNNQDLLEAVDRIEPDILVFTGNLYSSKEEDPQRVLQAIRPLTQAYPSFYIRGDQEIAYDQEKGGLGRRKLEDMGLTLLNNRQVPIYRRESRILLAGLEPGKKIYARGGKDRLNLGKYLAHQGHAYTILLAHHPAYWKDYMAWGADLSLSGYFQGGLVRLPILGGLVSPAGSPLPSFDRGIYKSRDKNLVVSGGMGRPRGKIRLFNRPQLVVVRLQSLSIH